MNNPKKGHTTNQKTNGTQRKVKQQKSKKNDCTTALIYPQPNGQGKPINNKGANRKLEQKEKISVKIEIIKNKVIRTRGLLKAITDCNT